MGAAAASTRRATGAAASPTIASSRCGARCWSSATSIQPNDVGLRGSRSRTSRSTDDAPRLELVVAPDAREPEQDVGEHRVSARRRVVVDLLLARDEPLAVDRRLEEPAALVVCEQRDGERREAVRLAQVRGSPLATCSSISPYATSA